MNNEIIKLAKSIEYFENFGYEINPNITAQKIKDYEFSLSKKINSESIPVKNREFKLKILEESFNTIKEIIRDKSSKAQKIKEAKRWLKNRNGKIEEQRDAAQKEKHHEDKIVNLEEDGSNESESLVDGVISNGDVNLEQYEEALKNFAKKIVDEERQVVEAGEVIGEQVEEETDKIEEELGSEEYTNRKTSYSFNRKNNNSLVQIIEIKDDIMGVAIDDIDAVFSRLEDEDVSTYIILEEINDREVKEINYLYGNIDFEWLVTSDDAQLYIESVLNRKVLDKGIRKYCGILPEFLINESGEALAKWDRNIVTRISEKILSKAYRGKQEEQKEKYVFGKKFMEYATRNLEKTEVEEKRIVFFKSGIIIYDDVVGNRYSYYMETTDESKRELNSFIVTNIDEERLDADEIYRQNFVNSICSSKKLEKINKQKYQYLGNIKEDGTLGDDIRIGKSFSKLNILTAKELDK